jgi:hypothetical protein
LRSGRPSSVALEGVNITIDPEAPVVRSKMISTNEDDFQVCAQGMHLLSQEGDGSVRKLAHSEVIVVRTMFLRPSQNGQLRKRAMGRVQCCKDQRPQKPPLEAPGSAWSGPLTGKDLGNHFHGTTPPYPALGRLPSSHVSHHGPPRAASSSRSQERPDEERRRHSPRTAPSL